MIDHKTRILIISIIFCLLFMVTEICDISAQSASSPIYWDTPLAPNDVRIGPHYIEMPIGRIFLIRKDNTYGAIKFIKSWTGWTKDDLYTTYDSWFQDDGSGDFSKKNVKFENRNASITLWGIGRLSFNLGDSEVHCGMFKLSWGYKYLVEFFGQSPCTSDCGVEIAPTKWKDIKEINVLDPRLKWYKYDKDRLRMDIPVETLW
jgi:hypothetical protein